MPTDRISEQTVANLQIVATKKADAFMAAAGQQMDPKQAVDWSLAAKNSIAVALSCEQLLKTRGSAQR